MEDSNNHLLAYEQKVNEIKLSLFAEALNFTKIDNAFNNSIKDLLENAVDFIKRNPSVMTSSKSDIQELINALNIKNKESNITGADVIGAYSLQEIADFINSLTGLIKDEKAFFLEIIKLIICGCDWIKK